MTEKNYREKIEKIEKEKQTKLGYFLNAVLGSGEQHFLSGKHNYFGPNTKVFDRLIFIYDKINDKPTGIYPYYQPTGRLDKVAMIHDLLYYSNNEYIDKIADEFLKKELYNKFVYTEENATSKHDILLKSGKKTTKSNDKNNVIAENQAFDEAQDIIVKYLIKFIKNPNEKFDDSKIKFEPIKNFVTNTLPLVLQIYKNVEALANDKDVDDYRLKLNVYDSFKKYIKSTNDKQYDDVFNYSDDLFNKYNGEQIIIYDNGITEMAGVLKNFRDEIGILNQKRNQIYSIKKSITKSKTLTNPTIIKHNKALGDIIVSLQKDYIKDKNLDVDIADLLKKFTPESLFRKLMFLENLFSTSTGKTDYDKILKNNYNVEPENWPVNNLFEASKKEFIKNLQIDNNEVDDVYYDTIQQINEYVKNTPLGKESDMIQLLKIIDKPPQAKEPSESDILLVNPVLIDVPRIGKENMDKLRRLKYLILKKNKLEVSPEGDVTKNKKKLSDSLTHHIFREYNDLYNKAVIISNPENKQWEENKKNFVETLDKKVINYVKHSGEEIVKDIDMNFDKLSDFDSIIYYDSDLDIITYGASKKFTPEEINNIPILIIKNLSKLEKLIGEYKKNKLPTKENEVLYDKLINMVKIGAQNENLYMKSDNFDVGKRVDFIPLGNEIAREIIKMKQTIEKIPPVGSAPPVGPIPPFVAPVVLPFGSVPPADPVPKPEKKRELLGPVEKYFLGTVADSLGPERLKELNFYKNKANEQLNALEIIIKNNKSPGEVEKAKEEYTAIIDKFEDYMYDYNDVYNKSKDEEIPEKMKMLDVQIKNEFGGIDPKIPPVVPPVDPNARPVVPPIDPNAPPVVRSARPVIPPIPPKQSKFAKFETEKVSLKKKVGQIRPHLKMGTGELVEEPKESIINDIKSWHLFNMVFDEGQAGGHMDNPLALLEDQENYKNTYRVGYEDNINWDNYAWSSNFWDPEPFANKDDIKKQIKMNDYNTRTFKKENPKVYEMAEVPFKNVLASRVAKISNPQMLGINSYPFDKFVETYNTSLFDADFENNKLLMGDFIN